MNAAAVELLREIRQHAATVRTILSEVIGPTSDGYAAGKALSEEHAFAYHSEQAQAFATDHVDLLQAPTFQPFRNCSGLRVLWHKRPFEEAKPLSVRFALFDHYPWRTSWFEQIGIGICITELR